MARPLRLQVAGAWYHVLGRGVQRRTVFARDGDREHFLELLEKMAARFACNVSAYVLMPNHFHLFLQTMEPNLSRAIQWLTTSYGVWSNRRYDRGGHLFRGRFKAVIVDPNQWAVSLTRYIHLDPVRTRPQGLGKRSRPAAQQRSNRAPSTELVQKQLALLREYPWSSYRAYAGYMKPPPWLKIDWILQGGGRSRSNQHKWYRSYCESAIREGVEDPLADSVLYQMCLGGREFLQAMIKKKRGRQVLTTLSRPTLDEIKRAVTRVRGEPWDKFAGRHGDWGRDLALCLAFEMSGKALHQIARGFSIMGTSATSMAIKRFEQRMAKDKTLRKVYSQVQELLQPGSKTV